MPSSDSITDRDLYRYAHLGAPEFVKDASGLELVGDGGMNTALYADPFDQSYPMHTAAATWVSHAKFAEESIKMDAGRREDVGRRLDKAARYFGIRRESEEVGRRILASRLFDETKLADSEFAWVAGPERRMRIHTADDVIKAAGYLMDRRDAFTYADRATIANRILDKATGMGVSLGALEYALEKVAGRGGASRGLVKAAARRRAAILRRDSPDVASDLDAIASDAASGKGPIPREKLAGLAAALDEVDRKLGLRGRDGDPGFPEDDLFRINDKAASDFLANHVATASGAVYSIAALDGLDPDALVGMAGEKAAAMAVGPYVAGTKVAAELASSSPPAAAFLEAALKVAGITPVMKVTPVGGRIDRAELLRLASLCRPRQTHNP